jgi:23S rRNA (guanosine2251-2'-O)-methyltransferase
VSAERRIAGFHPVREALRREPERIVRVLVERGRTSRRSREIGELCRSAGVRVESASEGELTRFAPGVHNGFAAELSGPLFASSGSAGADSELVVLAEDVQDPRNLGALLRVCEGVGVGRVLVREHGSAPLTEAVVKASAGAAEWLVPERIGSPAQVLAALKQEGYWIYGLAAEGEPPWAIDLRGKVVICVGGEHEGLRRLTRERCDRLIGLPMRGRVESLNLATAAAAVLYEAVRQRTAPSLSGGSASR